MIESGRRRTSPSEILPTIISYIYIYWWVKRANLRHWVDRTSLAFLLGFAVLVLTEVVVELVGHSVPEHPVWLRIVFFVAISAIIYVKFRELGGRKQQASFIDAAREVTQRLSQPYQVGSADRLIQELVGHAQLTFHRKGWRWGGLRRKPVSVNAALVENGALHIRYEHPEANEDRHGPPIQVGVGGAGICFEDSCLVYIPRKRLRHAIVQPIDDDPGEEPFSVVSDVFEKRDGHGEYRAILSVPIRAYGRSFGVLNLDSPKPNAFRRIDFEQATFFGFALASVLLHHEGVSVEAEVPPLETT